MAGARRPSSQTAERGSLQSPPGRAPVRVTARARVAWRRWRESADALSSSKVPLLPKTEIAGIANGAGELLAGAVGVGLFLARFLTAFVGDHGFVAVGELDLTLGA